MVFTIFNLSITAQDFLFETEANEYTSGKLSFLKEKSSEVFAASVA